MHNLKQVTMSLFHNHLPELLERREIFIQIQNWDIVQTQKSVAIYHSFIKLTHLNSLMFLYWAQWGYLAINKNK